MRDLNFLAFCSFQSSWDSARPSVLWSDWHVVSRLCHRRTVPWLAFVPRFIGIWSGKIALPFPTIHDFCRPLVNPDQNAPIEVRLRAVSAIMRFSPKNKLPIHRDIKQIFWVQNCKCFLFHENWHIFWGAQNMDESFQDYSWIQDFEAAFP